MLLEGVFPAIPTPFDVDGQCDVGQLERNVERYGQSTIAGLVVLGSTGEAVMLGDEETRAVLKAAAEASRAEQVLVAGIGRESLSETLRLAEFAAERQYDAVLVRTPHYYGPNMQPAEMLAYYRGLADRSPLPVVLYSIPKFTHYELPLEVVAELAQHPNVIGMKDSSGRVERIADLVRTTRSIKKTVVVTNAGTAVTGRMLSAAPAGLIEGVGAVLGERSAIAIAQPPRTPIEMQSKEVAFQVLAGAAEKLKPALEAGASGGVLAMAACIPDACQEMYAAWRSQDGALAEEKQARILEACEVVIGRYGLPGVKAGCDAAGYPSGAPRIPLLPVSGEAQREIARALAAFME